MRSVASLENSHDHRLKLPVCAQYSLYAFLFIYLLSLFLIELRLFFNSLLFYLSTISYNRHTKRCTGCTYLPERCFCCTRLCSSSQSVTVKRKEKHALSSVCSCGRTTCLWRRRKNPQSQKTKSRKHSGAAQGQIKAHTHTHRM